MEGYCITVNELETRLEEMIGMVESRGRVIVVDDNGTPIAGIVSPVELDEAETTLELLRRGETD